MSVLFIPIYSMRSYETGKYSILKDGNFQLTMARVLATDFDRIVVTVPSDSSDFNETLARFESLTRVSFVKAEYGVNAVETRDTFWSKNAGTIQTLRSSVKGIEALVTDITGYDGDLPVVFNFNITKLPELDRPYIDRFFETDLASIEQSMFTTVLNPRQRQYILQCRPELIGKVFVNTLCAHVNLLPNVESTAPFDFEQKKIFWPFRISDKAYRFEEFLEIFDASSLPAAGFSIVVTDPNDTLKTDRPYLTKIKPSKEEYYRLLARRPIVVMLDDVDLVLHPGTVEFIHYQCPLIAFENDLFKNKNSINDLADVVYQLQNISAEPINGDEFVYQPGEIDFLYNQDVFDAWRG